MGGENVKFCFTFSTILSRESYTSYFFGFICFLSFSSMFVALDTSAASISHTCFAVDNCTRICTMIPCSKTSVTPNVLGSCCWTMRAAEVWSYSQSQNRLLREVFWLYRLHTQRKCRQAAYTKLAESCHNLKIWKTSLQKLFRKHVIGMPVLSAEMSLPILPWNRKRCFFAQQWQSHNITV